jgi:hypothetical protein
MALYAGGNGRVAACPECLHQEPVTGPRIVHGLVMVPLNRHIVAATVAGEVDPGMGQSHVKASVIMATKDVPLCVFREA